MSAKLERAMSAIRRFKWLILIITLLGTAGGVLAARYIDPKYQVASTIWIAEGQDARGPIRPDQLLAQNAWGELLQSYAILEPVARQLQLYVKWASPADSVLFRGFDAAPDLRPGEYSLRIDPATRSYALSVTRNRSQLEIERGALGDSVGRSAGFLWQPSADLLSTRSSVDFSLVTPREAAVELSERLNIRQTEGSRFMRLYLQGTRPEILAQTMNSLTTEFVNAAALLKRGQLTEVSNTLREQLDFSQASLTNAESALEGFKVRTATLPTDNVVVAGGSMITTSPALSDFFNQRVAADNIQRDREALERILADSRQTGIRPEALLAVPTILNNSPNLKAALTEHTMLEANYRTLATKWKPEAPLMVEAQRKLDEMEKVTLPAIAGQVLAQYRQQEAEMDTRIAGASREIRQIPQRAIEEQRLQREVTVADELYTNLKQRYAEASLAEASAVPDVSVLDPAVAPERPVSDTAPMILLMVIGGSLAAGILLALLLDLVDKRFRYPDQASHELGLEILGGIPTIRRTRSGQTRLEDATQLVESFRALRLNVRNAVDNGGSVAVTVSSPGPGDGKSFISSNLALSFAEAGFRTLLIDGDIRRGQLHSMFSVAQRPGLVDYLFGEAALEDVVRATSHRNLSLLSCGSRRQRGPELLASDETSRVIRALRAQFDAVIVDSAPLGAGIDPFALGAATGNLMIVLRTGRTDRKLAQAKLSVLDRMPVRLIGAVLNDIRAEGSYKYYSYLDGYGVREDEEKPERLSAGARRAPVAAGRGSDGGRGSAE
jgi:capsular exopolysaccharide synthesis family protein